MVKTCEYVDFFGFSFPRNLIRCRIVDFDMIYITRFLNET